MAPTQRDITRAILNWLEAYARVGPPSTSGLVEAHCKLGCRIQASPQAALPRLVGLRSAEAPIAACTTRERLVLALRYGGGVPDVEGVWVNDVWVEQVRHRLVALEIIAAVIGSTPRGVELTINRARRKIAEALRGEG